MKNPFFKIEKSISSLFKKEFALFTRNGTTAIWLLLKALGLKKKKIVVPVNVCVAVPLAIILSGNEPYFVDINEDFTIDPKELRNVKSSDVKGVIFPYMYGNTAKIDDIVEICNEYELLL